MSPLNTLTHETLIAPSPPLSFNRVPLSPSRDLKPPRASLSFTSAAREPCRLLLLLFPLTARVVPPCRPAQYPRAASSALSRSTSPPRPHTATTLLLVSPAGRYPSPPLISRSAACRHTATASLLLKYSPRCSPLCSRAVPCCLPEVTRPCRRTDTLRSRASTLSTSGCLAVAPSKPSDLGAPAPLQVYKCETSIRCLIDLKDPSFVKPTICKFLYVPC